MFSDQDCMSAHISIISLTLGSSVVHKVVLLSLSLGTNKNAIWPCARLIGRLVETNMELILKAVQNAILTVQSNLSYAFCVKRL